MQKIPTIKILKAALGILAVAAGISAQAQPYSNAVMALNPVAYWPLNEPNPGPSSIYTGLTAANSGTLGASANGYYGAWYQPNGNQWYITNNIALTNGVAGTGDQALWCKPNGQNNGQYVVIPRTRGGVANTNITLVPPFSIEAWVWPNATSSGTYGIVAQGGSFQNFGGPNPTNPYYGGTGTGNAFAGVVVGQYNQFFLFDCFATNNTVNNGKGSELDSPTGGLGPVTNHWNYLVCTFDGTNEMMYINNVLAAHKTATKNAAGLYFVPDLSTPMIIGTGPEITAGSGEGGINMNGCIDEVAIYHELLPLSSMTNHYTNAMTANYPAAVMQDSPVQYYRFNDGQIAGNLGYPAASFPVATNYGSLGGSANGLYQPGTTPGVAGPPFVGFGSNTAVAINGWFGAVDVGGGALPSALNPVGKVPFSMVSWFQGNSADAPARFQEILGHGNNSYRFGVGQTCGENHFNPGPVELQFANPQDMITNHAVDNDGNWHMIAGVTDGTNAYMYLDGFLVKSTNVGGGINITGSGTDVLLGGDPQFTAASYNSANTVRNYDGQIAQVAMWSSALSGAQVQSLFNAAGVPPTFISSSAGATNNQGATVTLSSLFGGSGPFSYQWYNNSGPVTGQTNQNLVYTNIPASASGTYYVIATTPYGTATSSNATVLIYGPPVIQVQTQTNLEIFAGESPVLSVVASGAPPILYQWYSNGVAISGATNSALTLANVQTNATYDVTLTNFVGGGYLTNQPISVTVEPYPTAPYPVTVLADSPIAFWRLDESDGNTAYDYVGGNNGTYTNTILDYTSSYNPNTDPTEGNAPGFGINSTNNSYVGWIPTNINFAAPTNVNGEFSVECWMQQYLVFNQAGIVALGYGNGGEEFTMDTGGGTLTSYFLRFYARDAGDAAVNASSTFQPASDGNWHHVVGVCDEAHGAVKIYIDGTNAQTASIPANSGVYSSLQSMTIGARQESQGSQYDNQLIGAIDEVAVYNYALTAAQVQNHYFAAGIAPKITSLTPASQTVNMGSSATFTAAVYGSGPQTYQWTDQNNNILSTNLTLVVSNAQAGSQGTYYFNVSNPYGSASGNVSLSVNLGPPVQTQDISPLNQTVLLYSGLDTISFSYGVSGSAPFSYQWYEDGGQIAGATNSSYTFIAPPGTNTFYVTVTNADTASQNGGNPLVSSTATVIGIQPPQLNPANYAYRLRITFPGYTGTPVTNFPALITFNQETIPGFDYGQFQPGASDLRFADASGTAILPYEIDEWNDGGVSSIWVQIPVLNGSNIWAYWGNSSDTDTLIPSTNVWTAANYQIVYHLKEPSIPYADSTGVYPATNGVSPAPAPGVVGHAGSFARTAWLTPGKVTLSNQFTASAWINLTNAATDIQAIWVSQVGGYGSNGFSWFVDTYQSTDRVVHFDSGNGAGSGADPTSSPFAVQPNSWHFMVSVWDQVAGRVTNYVDGVAEGAGTAVTTFSLTNQLNLGAFLNPTYQFDGEIDEARIRYGISSTNWIQTTFLNIASGSFVAYSSVNLAPPLYITPSTNGYIMSWPTNGGNFGLQTTTSLDVPQTWNAVTTPAPVMTNGMWEQTIQPGAGSHFYRLKSQ